jgi:hypothetical protein
MNPSALINAWTETDPYPFLTVELDTTTAYEGTKSVKLTEAGFVAYGGADGYISKTYTGYSPGETVPVSVRMMTSRPLGNPPGGVNKHGMRVNGTMIPLDAGLAANVWHELGGVAIADGSGNVDVQIGFFNMVIPTGSAGDFITYIEPLSTPAAPTYELRRAA